MITLPTSDELKQANLAHISLYDKALDSIEAQYIQASDMAKQRFDRILDDIQDDVDIPNLQEYLDLPVYRLESSLSPTDYRAFIVEEKGNDYLPLEAFSDADTTIRIVSDLLCHSPTSHANIVDWDKVLALNTEAVSSDKMQGIAILLKLKLIEHALTEELPYYIDSDSGYVITEPTFSFDVALNPQGNPSMVTLAGHLFIGESEYSVTISVSRSGGFLVIGFQISASGVFHDGDLDTVQGCLDFGRILKSLQVSYYPQVCMLKITDLIHRSSLNLQTCYDVFKEYLDKGCDEVSALYESISARLSSLDALTPKQGLALLKRITSKAKSVFSDSGEDSDSIYDTGMNAGETEPLLYTFGTTLLDILIPTVTAVVTILLAIWNPIAALVGSVISTLVSQLINLFVYNTGATARIENPDGLAVYPTPILYGSFNVTRTYAALNPWIVKFLKLGDAIIETPWFTVLTSNLGISDQENLDTIHYEIYANVNYGWRYCPDPAWGPGIAHIDGMAALTNNIGSSQTWRAGIRNDDVLAGFSLSQDNSTTPFNWSISNRDYFNPLDRWEDFATDPLTACKRDNWQQLVSSGWPATDSFAPARPSRVTEHGGLEYDERYVDSNMLFFGSRVGCAIAFSSILALCYKSNLGTVSFSGSEWPILTMKNVYYIAPNYYDTLGSTYPMYGYIDESSNKWDDMVSDFNTSTRSLVDLLQTWYPSEDSHGMLTLLYKLYAKASFYDENDPARVSLITKPVNISTRSQSYSLLFSTPSYSGRAAVNTALILAGIAAAAAAVAVAAVKIKKKVNGYMAKRYAECQALYSDLIENPDSTAADARYAQKKIKGYNILAGMLGYSKLSLISGWEDGGGSASNLGGNVLSTLAGMNQKVQSTEDVTHQIAEQGVSVDLDPVVKLISG